MSLRRRTTFRAASGFVLALAVSVPAVLLVTGGDAGAGGPEAKITVAKQESGPFVDAFRLNLDPGQANTLYLKVKNIGTSQLQGHLADGANPNLALKWFTRWQGGENITNDVESDYPFSLQPGQVRKFRWKVKLAGGGGCSETYVNWPLVGTDFVRVRVNTNACN